jgi:hypothetical protein
MERTRVVATAVVEGVAALEAGVWAIHEALLDGDLLTAERALQQTLRQVGGAVLSAVLQGRAQGAEADAVTCPQCGRHLELPRFSGEFTTRWRTRRLG